MITIVIASVSQIQLKQVTRNIINTIGVEHEIISFDNSEGKVGLCEIYNRGAQKANFNTICFMHEDIEIYTQNWGQLVIDSFHQNQTLGAIGVAGSAYKTFSPSGWGAESKICPVRYSNYVQSYKHLNKPSETIYFNPTDSRLAKVVSIDGMWICTRKDIVLKKPFDQNLLKGFHCYDIDFCLSLFGQYDVAVTFDILMQHFSEGTYTKGWIEETLKLHEKFKAILPVATVSIDEREQFQMEKRAFRLFIEKLYHLGYSLKFVNNLLSQYHSTHLLPSSLYYKLSYYAYKYFLFGKRKKP